MNSFSNIEFINFESLPNNDHENVLESKDIEMEYLNDFLLEKFETEYENQTNDSIIMNDNNSQVSFYSDVKGNKINPNDSFASLPTYEISLFGECNRSSSPSSIGEVRCEVLEKNFTCNYENCNKTFKFRWILDRHYLSHKAAKLYKCTFKGCTKSYKSKENLTLHFKNIHLKEKPYNCKFCPSVFSHRNGKTYHERKFHTNFLPHKCNIGGKANYLITKHLLECECTFASKSALTYHVKSQHSDKSSKRASSLKSGRSKFNQEMLKIVNEFEISECTNNNFLTDN